MQAPGSRAESFRSRRCNRSSGQGGDVPRRDDHHHLLACTGPMIAANRMDVPMQRSKFPAISVHALIVPLCLFGLLVGRGTGAVGQTPAPSLTFDVASVRPSAPLDMAKLQADMQAGKMPNFGMHLDGLRAEYNYMSLKELVVAAYKVKPYQVNCPDWMATQRYATSSRAHAGRRKQGRRASYAEKCSLEDRFRRRRIPNKRKCRCWRWWWPRVAQS